MTTQDLIRADLATVYDEIAAFFASSPSAESILSFRLSNPSERFISDLLEANRTRGLTPDERAALDEYAHLERLVQAIKVLVHSKQDGPR